MQCFLGKVGIAKCSNHEACNLVAWPETLVSLPACLTVAFEGHHSLKKAIPKINGNGYFAKSDAAVLSPPVCGGIDDENSVVLCIGYFPLILTCAAL
ncbi:TPA: hypothetical protein HA361_06990 [Candidatus Woesearchaeota archaeon]|nr:hypothetical protein [Candidatus Woesearchaeota archaeon]